MNALLDVARAIYTDDVVSREVGYPVRVQVLSEAGEWAGALAIGPADPSASKDSAADSYAWRALTEDEASVRALERAFADLIAMWREKCLPNMREVLA